MRSPRYPTNEKASVEVYGKAGNVIAEVKNISRSGACIHWLHTDFDLEPGDLVRMTINLSSINKMHNLSAQVVWTEGKSSGVNFLTADQVFEKMIEKT